MTEDHAAKIRANRLNWDQRAPIHAASEMYDLDGLLADPDRLTDVVTDDLAMLLPHLAEKTIEGLDVVHLQCHIGTDTLSLARAGANVVGVDFSTESLKIARSLAEGAGLPISYVESEVTRAHHALRRRFDVVYTSIGTITWLPDLTAWATAIAALLKPGGTFFIRDGHPMLYTLDFERPDQELVVGYAYFPSGSPQIWDDATTYTDGDHSSITHTRQYEWPHSISETLTVLLDAGLSIIRFGEQQTLPWQALPFMTEKDGRFALPEHLRDLVPLTFSIVARKPAFT